MQRRSERQMPLPLASGAPPAGRERREEELRAAHRAARVALPFELALRDPALGICLRCFAEARRGRRPGR